MPLQPSSRRWQAPPRHGRPKRPAWRPQSGVETGAPSRRNQCARPRSAKKSPYLGFQAAGCYLPERHQQGAVGCSRCSQNRVTDVLGDSTRAAAAHDSINTAAVLIWRIKSASAQLEVLASKIQTQVAIEVMKTQPNLAAIFEGGANLRLNAEKFSGSPLFKARAGTGVVKAESRVTTTTKSSDSAILRYAAQLRLPFENRA